MVGGTVVVVVVEVVVVLGAAVVVVVGAGLGVTTGALVPGTTANDAEAGVVVTMRVVPCWGVVVVDAPGALDVVVDGALGGVVVGSVLGTVVIGPRSCTLCAGNRGLEPPGAITTSTASATPTTARPASIPARCERTPRPG